MTTPRIGTELAEGKGVNGMETAFSMKYLIAAYIIFVLLLSGLTTANWHKAGLQSDKNYLDNSLNFELLKIKSASSKMLVAHNIESEVVLPPNLEQLRIRNLKA